MSKEAGWGVVLGLAIIAPLLVPIGIRAFGRDRYTERWGRYEYSITCSGSIVFSGESFRKENPAELDAIAGRILVEWFYSPEGERELQNEPRCEEYGCTAYLRGFGVGEAVGR